MQSGQIARVETAPELMVINMAEGQSVWIDEYH